MKNKDKFLKVYASLALDVRKEIILAIDKQPISWEAAFYEVSNETKKGEEILKKLIELEMI